MSSITDSTMSLNVMTITLNMGMHYSQYFNYSFHCEENLSFGLKFYDILTPSMEIENKLYDTLCLHD